MALEAAIRENTAAIRDLIAQLRGAAPADEQPKPNAEIQKSPPEADRPAFLDYDRDVKPILLGAVARNKPAVLEVLGSFGVKKGSEVPAERLADLLTALGAI